MAEPTPQPRARRLDRWTFNRLLLLSGFAVLVPASLLLSGGGISALTILLISVVPSLALIAVVFRKDRPWSYLAAGIVISLLPILTIAFGYAALLNPQDGPTFSGTILALLALGYALPAGVQGYRQGRQGLAQPTAREVLRTRRGLAAIVVAAVCAGAIVSSALAYTKALTDVSGGAGYDFVPQGSVRIVAKNFAFHPRSVNLTVGNITEIVVTNEDSTYHTFTYIDPESGLRRNHDLLSSSTTRFLVRFAQPHTSPSIRFWCVPHEYAGMDGNLTVS